MKVNDIERELLNIWRLSAPRVQDFIMSLLRWNYKRIRRNEQKKRKQTGNVCNKVTAKVSKTKSKTKEGKEEK